MEITLVGNAGIFLEIGGVRLLVDGLYDPKDIGFSPIPKDILKDMLKGVGVFSNIDYLLFTHYHLDHFSLDYLKIYLNNNKVKKVILPDDSLVRKELREYNHITTYLKNDNYNIGEILDIKYFPVPHMGKEYADIQNYMYYIKSKGESILITGDGDYTSELIDTLKNLNVENIVINPLFFNNIRGQKVLKSLNKLKNVIVYHIPFEGEDNWHLRSLVSRDINRFKIEKYTSYQLDTKLKKLII